MATLSNIFPLPDPKSPKNVQSVAWINQKINSPEGLKFFDCLGQIQKALDDKDVDQAQINMYYCTNLILGSKHFKSDHDKADIIRGFKESLDNLKAELSEKK